MGAARKTYVGFGLGAIQAGLFAYEAGRSGHFERLVIAEVLPEVVAAVRRANGNCRVNVATRRAVEVREIPGLEVFNPADPADARELAAALEQASEIGTALPSVEFYTRGNPSPASLIAGALRKKREDCNLPSCVIYTAENHNRAAELLESACRSHWASSLRVEGAAQFLNTVIGKMSGVITGAGQIQKEGLACLADGLDRAFLVEEFNRILITRITLPGFRRGIEVFIEKPDLLPFEEAKLYGHNAVHALLGYLGRRKGLELMSDAAADAELMKLARDAFLEESGAALIAKHGGRDRLFTPEGYRAYAEDLLGRMTNPFLRDRIERVTRDTKRKLGWEDRFVGTMRLALDAGVRPWRLALGAAAAVQALESGLDVDAILRGIWQANDEPPGRMAALIGLIREAFEKLKL
jgi:mannitol-1-phosphate 5-dehydrogenase